MQPELVQYHAGGLRTNLINSQSSYLSVTVFDKIFQNLVIHQLKKKISSPTQFFSCHSPISSQRMYAQIPGSWHCVCYGGPRLIVFSVSTTLSTIHHCSSNVCSLRVLCSSKLTPITVFLSGILQIQYYRDCCQFGLRNSLVWWWTLIGSTFWLFSHASWLLASWLLYFWLLSKMKFALCWTTRDPTTSCCPVAADYTQCGLSPGHHGLHKCLLLESSATDKP